MRHPVSICAVLVVGACKSLDVPQQLPIPDDAIVYRIEPSLLTYTFVDTTHNNDTHLRWIIDPPPPTVTLAGWNCIALSPHTPTDTAGTFIFAYFGPNIGRLDRVDHGVVDTTNGFFLQANVGTHGSFAVTSTGLLHLFWADGVLARYFDAAAIIRLASDTIFSDAVLSKKADSVHTEWRVRWVRAPNCNS